MPYLLFLGVIVIGILLAYSGAWWAAPILLIGFVLYLMRERRTTGALGAVEKGREVEPTGMPRSSTGNAETANQRVGQG